MHHFWMILTELESQGGINTVYLDAPQVNAYLIDEIEKIGLIYRDHSKLNKQSDDDLTHFFPKRAFTLTEIGQLLRANANFHTIESGVDIRCLY